MNGKWTLYILHVYEDTNGKTNYLWNVEAPCSAMAGVIM